MIYTTRNRVRFYLHDLDGLRQEIADIQADLEQYRAMATDEFLIYNTVQANAQQDKDQDPYPDGYTSDGSQHNKYNSHSRVETLSINRLEFIMRLEQEYFDKKNLLDAIKCTVVFIEKFNKSLDKQLLQLRYNQHLSFKQISKVTKYPLQSLYNQDNRLIDSVIKNYCIRIK